MLKFFENTPPQTAAPLSAPVQEKLELFLSQIFPDLLGENKLSSERIDQIKEDLKQMIANACQHTQQEITLASARQQLLEGKYDQNIFSDHPQLNPQIKLLIQQDNHTFMQHLFMKCEKSILDFWLDQAGARIPKDGIAQAIRMHANKCVFERLAQENYFKDLPVQDKEILVRQASYFLKDKPESLSFLKQILSRQEAAFGIL